MFGVDENKGIWPHLEGWERIIMYALVAFMWPMTILERCWMRRKNANRGPNE